MGQYRVWLNEEESDRLTIVSGRIMPRGIGPDRREETPIQALPAWHPKQGAGNRKYVTDVLCYLCLISFLAPTCHET